MALVLLNDVLGVRVGVERVHQDKRHVDLVCAVEIFNLANREIEERHSIADLNDRLGSNTTHGGTETSIELQYRELVQERDGLGVCKVVVVDDLALGRWRNAVPVESASLRLIVQIPAEKTKEVVHLSLE